MYNEVNTKCNLPAQIDLYAVDGMEYKFLFMTKGGGSANKTYLYQETKALINPDTLVKFLVEKMKTLGTAACPPYHVAFVIGGTSAEMNLKTVKLASAKYYDNLPTKGNEWGQAFRDIELEKEVLKAAQNSGIGAQFGGKYFGLMMFASFVYPAMELLVQLVLEFLALQTVILKLKLIRTDFGLKNWMITLMN